jgi:CRP/FNR family transcriptional regulator, anaerobic regulatory protein
MPNNFTEFPLHRPELLETLRRGDRLLTEAMSQDRKRSRKGDEIIRASERCDTIYRLEAGWVCRSRVLDDGRRSIVTVFLPGDLFGVKSMLSTEPPDAVVALSNVTALAIKHDRLQQLFAAEPSVALRLAFQLGEDERRLHNYLIALGRGNAEERIATMLLELHGRLLLAGITQNGAFQMPLTQQEIGDFTGLTLVHINRVLRRLRENGLATVDRRTVEIHDLPKLHRLALPILDTFQRTRPEFGGGRQQLWH